MLKVFLTNTKQERTAKIDEFFWKDFVIITLKLLKNVCISLKNMESNSAGPANGLYIIVR